MTKEQALKTKHEAFLAMRKLLAEPGSWTKYHLALTAMGASVSPNDPRAACWCLNGAAEKVGFAPATLRVVMMAAFGATSSVACWNDDYDRTHAEVLELLDKCIDLTAPEAEVKPTP